MCGMTMLHSQKVPLTLVPMILSKASSLLETERQPLLSHFNEQRHPRLTPAIYQVTITGPYAPQGAGDTPSRRRIFVCTPTGASPPQEEEACAEEILSTLMRRAYRRPISAADVEGAMTFYREGRSAGDFDAGIGSALTAVLVSPEFLFRVELDPDQVASGDAYRVSDLALASRLSFFLWSSLPDDELLDVAIRGELSRPGELERQARRLLVDSRSHNLASNFAGQWLLLRNLAAVSPSPRLYPDFDDNLRQAFRQLDKIAPDLNRAMIEDIQQRSEELFQQCMSSLEKTLQLWKTADSLASEMARKPILEQREKLVGEVVQTVEHMSRTLASVQGITSRSDGDARLQRLRGELDQSLEVAKKVEQRIDSLLTGGRVQNLSEINKPK